MNKRLFFIAEIGINHNGDLELAKKMIKAAKKAGANAVKFQKRDIDEVYTQEFLDSPRESPWGTTQREQKAGIEFGEVAYREIDEYCVEQDIDWFASAWDLKSLEFIRKVHSCLRYNKIASPMMFNKEFIRTCKEFAQNNSVHTFFSTGMTRMFEVGNVVSNFDLRDLPFTVMHCVSQYPLQSENANMRNILKLADMLGVQNVGYSDHSLDNDLIIQAVTLGATAFERHVTFDRGMYGSDQKFSTTFEEFAEMVKVANKAYKSMGKLRYDAFECEVDARNKLV